MQHRITEPGPLLDGEGRLREPGWATSLLLDYRRADIRANGLRIKEWDYYCINNGRFALAVTIADNGYMGLDSISLLDLQQKWEITTSPMQVMTLGRKGFPTTSQTGNVSSLGKGYAMVFENDGTRRRLTGHMDKFHDGKPIDFSVTLTDAPEDSMVIATPFADKPTAFYYNQKINCLRAQGRVTYDGKIYEFRPETAFAVLDWGRGVWTYNNTWYWSSASGLVDGVPFGFNLGYGFGDTGAATENVLFYNGTAHKLSQVDFGIPQKRGKDDYLSPWKFTSDDDRLSLRFVPVLDRKSCTNVGVICSDQHQVFGRFTGEVTLDDGSILELRDFPGFAEKVHNKW